MTRRVLVARLDSLGDVLLAGPAVRAVAERADVVMLCGPRGAPAAAMLPGVRTILVWDSPWIAAPPPPVTPAAVDRLARLVRIARVDEAVVLTSFHQSPLPLALLLRLAGVGRITGASVDYAGSLLDVRLRPGEDLPEDIHEVDRACAIAAAAGFPSGDDRRLRVATPPDATALTGADPYVVLHPGAAVPARRWPVERFAEAARLLAARRRRVVVTGSAAERDLTAVVAAAAGESAVDLAGACDAPRLAGVLARADAVVVGNTGPAHLAAAVGAPVVSLFSPVVPSVRWAPYGVPSVLLGDQEAPCRGTRARGCPVPGHPCLAGVPGSAVVDAVERIARRRAPEPAPAAAPTAAAAAPADRGGAGAPPEAPGPAVRPVPATIGGMR